LSADCLNEVETGRWGIDEDERSFKEASKVETGGWGAVDEDERSFKEASIAIAIIMFVSSLYFKDALIANANALSSSKHCKEALIAISMSFSI
jgi:hypothetical protein